MKKEVVCEGQYINWDGVSNVAQFTDGSGEFCFAYDGSSEVTVVRTKNGKPLKKRITLKKQHPIFGTAVCDKNGNYYLVTGEANKGSDRNKETVFVSKYDKNGKHIKTVGDDGSSSLEYYYDSSFNTKIPFDAGCCSAAVSDNMLVVDYAREMYNGHQSNSLITVDVNSMESYKIPGIYNSHSFAQRVIPFKKGFVCLSEGDGYPRAFSVLYTDFSRDGYVNVYESESFHFWVDTAASKKGNMFVVNNNFAHTGGLANIGDKKIAMLGTSVKSLNSNAEKENEQLFVQIFDPARDLSKEGSFYTSGKRSGKGGTDGDKNVTDYGVKWLTNYDSKTKIYEPQIVAAGDKLVVLFEKYENGSFKGVYYTVLDENGGIMQKLKLFSKNARLNACVMPVYAGGKVYWVQNKGNSKELYINSIELE